MSLFEPEFFLLLVLPIVVYLIWDTGWERGHREGFKDGIERAASLTLAPPHGDVLRTATAMCREPGGPCANHVALVAAMDRARVAAMDRGTT